MSEGRRVLVIEDDATTAATVALYLDRCGFEAHTVADGRDGLTAARSGDYVLIILDLMLPSLDGLQLCRALRAESPVPIILLTARTTEDDKVRGLDLGADDYVPKPFSPRELMARVRAVLRRADGDGETPAEPLRFPGLTVDPGRHEVRHGDGTVDLTPTELRLLLTLVQAPLRVFRRAELVERALGLDYEGQERTIDAHIRNLRCKIEPDPSRPALIATVFGAGYRFVPPGDGEHVP